MAGIVAYKERESMSPTTGEVGVIRQEWRIKPIASYNMDDLYAAFGPNWTSYNPGARFVMEQRYIRRGVDEGWKLFDVYKTREEALAHVDTGATPVGAGLVKVQSKRERNIVAQKAAEVAKREAQYAAEAKRSQREQSQSAFRRVLEGKNAVWAQRYSDFAAAHQKDEALMATLRADSRLYDAIMDAVTVPAKVKAIKVFLARYAGGGGKRRKAAPQRRGLGKLVNEVGSMLRR